jgi:predicted RND superfamily exporter protein
LIFQSVKTGMISMVPNLTPVFLILGVMGFLAIPLDYNKLFVATIAIGIAVDDTIHLVSRYHHEFKRIGRYEEALRVAMVDVGRALVITSVTLVLGFSVLTFSLMASHAVFGTLLSSTIIVALIADFLLMPALILTFKPFGPEGTRSETLEDAPVELAAA